MTPEQWAKDNKKNIAREFIRKIGHDASDSPTGVFTAGLPGAGKTEFTRELLKDIEDKTLRIDMDEIATLMEGYSPRTANLFRGGASIILDKIYDQALKSHLDFVFDGTLSSPRALDNIHRAQEKGYKVKVYLIYQVPSIAWQFTKDRETVEHRAIDRKGFIETYFNIHANIEKLQISNKDVTISIILKDSKNHVGRIIEDVQDVYNEIPRPLAKAQLDRDIV